MGYFYQFASNVITNDFCTVRQARSFQHIVGNTNGTASKPEINDRRRQFQARVCTLDWAVYLTSGICRSPRSTCHVGFPGELPRLAGNVGCSGGSLRSACNVGFSSGSVWTNFTSSSPAKSSPLIVLTARHSRTFCRMIPTRRSTAFKCGSHRMGVRWSSAMDSLKCSLSFLTLWNLKTESGRVSEKCRL